MDDTVVAQTFSVSAGQHATKGKEKYIFYNGMRQMINALMLYETLDRFPVSHMSTPIRRR